MNVIEYIPLSSYFYEIYGVTALIHPHGTILHTVHTYVYLAEPSVAVQLAPDNFAALIFATPLDA